MDRRYSTCQRPWLHIPKDGASIDEFDIAKLVANLAEQFRHVVFDVGAQESAYINPSSEPRILRRFYQLVPLDSRMESGNVLTLTGYCWET